MGSLQGSGAPGGYSLPGVPWTSFFVPETGVAFHGTFWHNNFGVQMSHGCVNMRNADAKWLFRWSDPVWEVPVEDRSAWDRRGYGTRVTVI
jgi:lipoprotein-anchoring transpeptidase ErfK/SrfK